MKKLVKDLRAELRRMNHHCLCCKAEQSMITIHCGPSQTKEALRELFRVRKAVSFPDGGWKARAALPPERSECLGKGL